ncbi:hypothetical protein FQN54_004591 [Arachnomyces sp. PD_36]|nr:hypothetical protein FQN54_004591 [Arachnomyces sp. PD_36]
MINFVVEVFTLLSVSLFVILLRTYARWSTVGFREFCPDDYLILLAGAVFIGEAVTAYPFAAQSRALSNCCMTPEEREAVIPGSPEHHFRVMGSKVQLAGWTEYTTILWLSKLCMAFSYFRLTPGLLYIMRRIKFGIALICVTYVAAIFSSFMSCLPIEKNWQIYPDPGNFCQPAISKVRVYVVAILNVVTDLYIMMIMLPLIWKAKLRISKKIFLFILFGGGIFIITASIVRAVVILNSPKTGTLQAGLWACRESFVAIVVTNLPPIYPQIRRLTRRWNLGSLFSAPSGHGDTTTGRNYPLNSRSYSRSRKRDSKDPNAPYVPNTAAYDSDERIVLDMNTNHSAFNRTEPLPP